MSFVAAGFLLVKPRPRPDWSSASLLPPRIISASDCLCAQFPGAYALDWSARSDEDRAMEFDSIGLSPERRAAATNWATENFQKSFGWTGVFYGPEEARAARGMFFPGESELLLIGLGLPGEFVPEFLEYAAPDPPQEGYAPMGTSGSYEVVRKLQPLPDGQFLGFELLNVEFGSLSHSWLCNHLEVHFAETAGIKPNRWGLIEDLEAARQCSDEINDEKVGAEPGLWLPWALVKYDGG